MCLRVHFKPKSDDDLTTEILVKLEEKNHNGIQYIFIVDSGNESIHTTLFIPFNT